MSSSESCCSVVSSTFWRVSSSAVDVGQLGAANLRNWVGLMRARTGMDSARIMPATVAWMPDCSMKNHSTAPVAR
jgi:hypothetical protein